MIKNHLFTPNNVWHGLEARVRGNPLPEVIAR